MERGNCLKAADCKKLLAVPQNQLLAQSTGKAAGRSTPGLPELPEAGIIHPSITVSESCGQEWQTTKTPGLISARPQVSYQTEGKKCDRVQRKATVLCMVEVLCAHLNNLGQKKKKKSPFPIIHAFLVLFAIKA